MNPNISIIIPCYNQAQFLEECLQSVLDQSYENWECIIVNDGSPDHTEEVAQKWTAKDSRFSYFKKENGGVASARNFGMEKATGTRILPLDADDKIHKDYLALAVEKINDGYDFIYCKAQYFGDKNEEYNLYEYSFERLLQYNLIFSSAIFNREKSRTLKYDDQLKHGMEDWEFWISYFSLNPSKVCRIDQILFYYRIKEFSRNQSINTQSDKMHETKMYIFKKHEKTYLKYFGDYYDLLKQIRNLTEEKNRLLKIQNTRILKYYLSFKKIFQ